MLRYHGGDKVKKGTYWNAYTGERVDVSNEAVLPGNGKTRYYKLPATGMLFLGPFLGLVYAAFLPFIGIAMLVKLIADKVLGGILDAAASTISFGWRPVEAYLAGKKKRKSIEEKEKAKTEQKK
ncbi:MAG: hypothetical protein AB1488_06875 [Nitrospirota bacterium]